MNALIAVVAFALGVICTLVGSFEYLNHANAWVIVSRETIDNTRAQWARMQQQLERCQKKGWLEQNVI